MTHYEVLGVPRDADEQTIKKAYRRIALRHHDDHAGDDPASRATFEAATRAYEVLRDPLARRRYDRGVAAPQRPSDVLRRDSGRRMVEATFSSAPKASHPGTNTVSVVEVPDSLLRSGGVVRVPMPSGVVDVQVPPGAPRFGTVRDLGGPGRNGGAAGDHLIILVTRP
jgi:DnaJ-class molecular chaperone